MTRLPMATIENQQRQLEHKSRIQALRYLTASRIR